MPPPGTPWSKSHVRLFESFSALAFTFRSPNLFSPEAAPSSKFGAFLCFKPSSGVKVKVLFDRIWVPPILLGPDHPASHTSLKLEVTGPLHLPPTLPGWSSLRHLGYSPPPSSLAHLTLPNNLWWNQKPLFPTLEPCPPCFLPFLQIACHHLAGMPSAGIRPRACCPAIVCKPHESRGLVLFPL